MLPNWVPRARLNAETGPQRSDMTFRQNGQYNGIFWGRGGFLDEWSFWRIVRAAFLFPRLGSGSPFFGKLSDFTPNNHGGALFGQMSSFFLANCPRTLGSGHFGIQWFLALSPDFWPFVRPGGGCGGFLDEWSCYFGELSGSLFPRPGSGSPFFGKLSDFTINNHGGALFGQMSSFFWEINSVVLQLDLK